MDKLADWKAKTESSEYDEMRSRIVFAAHNLMSGKGVNALRLDDVASRVGCSRSSVYRYFDSKRDLVVAVLVNSLNEFALELTPYLRSLNDPVEQLVEGIYAPIHAIRNNPHIKEMWDPQNNNSVSLAALAIETVPQVMSLIMDPYLEEAKSEGRLRENITSEEASRWILMTSIAMGLFGSGGLTPTEEKDFVRKMIIPSLLSIPAS